ncbi:hypothetical protein G3O06_07250 [Burkholderia sp. Ac-20345]|uniref:hypothetical protein n=1 Tax=Burkholderia sp. Ac-20345 TaxID=2703891 RepID=UPI00197CA3C8|nr:hypothetical protein [Burkholderia sp. Ac-20345]MBN3777351.1 hypothetical protein [Burkholderia sp. Ac-20345]
MNNDSDEIADLRRLVISLSDELEIASEDVYRLMLRLDAYQMVLEGLCVTHSDRQTVLREVDTQIEQLTRMPATEPRVQERYIGQIMEHLGPPLIALSRRRRPSD